MQKKNYVKKKQTKKVSRPVLSAIKKVVDNQMKRAVEFKQHTDGFTFTPFFGGTSGAIISHLTAISQGNTDTTRLGDELHLQRIQVRGTVQNNAGALSNPWNQVRMLIFQYKSQDNNPSVDELLIASTASGGTRSCYSARNQDYLNIYNVLYDKMFIVEGGLANASNYGSSGRYAQLVNVVVPLKYCKRKIQYEASTSNAVNGIYMVIIGSTASVTQNPTCVMQWTMSYTDS